MTARTWRIIAQRLLTNEFLSWDVPLTGASRSRELSGPGGITGTIEPELRHILAEDGRPLIEEWSTALYYEEDGLLRGGGIVQSVSASRGGQLSLNAPGFTSYPTGMPIIKDYRPEDFEDPTVAFRNLWTHLQGYPDGSLGMTVNAPATYLRLSNGSGPYTVGQWENRDYGQELSGIAQAAPFDYVEDHTWNGSHTAINHSINIGFPRIGTRRLDLRLSQGENIVDFSPVGADGTRFSNEVYVYGTGEGFQQTREPSAVRDGRLRRPVMIPKRFYSIGQATTHAAQERRSRELKLDIAEVTIIDHPNAPIGAIVPGDDVMVEVSIPWFGDVRLWVRVLGITEGIDNPGKAVLKTQRSDFFVYAGATNPNPDKEPIIVTM